jgi:probable selenate reductase FAD-binding subunit
MVAIPFGWVLNMETIKPFNYFRPKTLDEALTLLAKYGEEAVLIAGGTDLLIMMKDRVITPGKLVDLQSIPDLNRVTWDEDERLNIGALTSISTLIESGLLRDKYTCLHEAAKSLGTPQVRNMATIGGNICRSSPSADMIPPLLVLDASVKLLGRQGERSLLLEDFITGPGVNELNNEILTEIRIDHDNRPYRTGFTKVGRLSEDLAKVNCAVKTVVNNGKFEDIKIALGAVAPTPVRARKVEDALKGEKTSLELIELASAKALEDIAPITDVRSSAEYRSQVSQVLIKRLVSKTVNSSGEV